MTSARVRWSVYPALGALALTAGIVAAHAHAATSPPFSLAYTVASQSHAGVSDLNGDGSGDVMVDEERPINEMQFRSGLSGGLLWSLPLSTQQVVAVIRARDGRPAVLTLEYSTSLLRALDGSTGQVLWSSTALATKPNSVILGYLPGKPSAATRILIGQPAVVGYRPVVVSGIDGSSRLAGLPGQTVVAIGDEDGDGYGDIAVSNGNELEVRSSTNGKTLWLRVLARQLVAVPEPLPDINRDHHPDLLVTDSADPIGTPATAVSGRTGKTLWTISLNTDIQVLGDANGDGAPDLIAIEPQGCAQEATAYSGLSGKVLWRRTYSNPPAACQSQPVPPYVDLAGDANADGVADVLVQFGPPGSDVGMVNGRSGNWLWRGSWPDRTRYEAGLNASFDNAGDDLAFNYLSPALTVFDGRTNAQLFSLPTPDQVWVTPAQAGQLTDDAQPDLVYATQPYDSAGAWTGRPVQVGVVDGQTRSVRWTVDIG